MFLCRILLFYYVLNVSRSGWQITVARFNFRKKKSLTLSKAIIIAQRPVSERIFRYRLPRFN